MLFYGCNSFPEKKELVGKWKVIKFDSEIKDISPVIIELGNKEALSTMYIFNDDNSMILSSRSNPNLTGKYELNAEKKTLTFYYKDENTGEDFTDIFTIKNFDDATMTLEQSLGEQDFIILTLNKLE